MKRLKSFVTVNSGELKGKRGQLVSYDRNKWYGVKFDDIDEVVEFKLYYLDQERPLKNNQRYLLPEYTDRYYTNKEIWEGYKKDKKRGESKKRSFSIWFEEENKEDVAIRDINFTEVKKKIIYALVNNKSFTVQISRYYKNGSSFMPLVQFNATENSYKFFTNSKRDKEILTFERGVKRLFGKY